MTTITDLPSDLLPILASCWSPEDLYSIMLTSKKCNEKFGLNGVTRAIYNNFTSTLRNPKIFGFYRRNVLAATEKNDLPMLKLMIGVFKAHYMQPSEQLYSYETYNFLFSRLILRNVWTNDADLLLEQILTYFTESVTLNDWIAQLVPELADLTLLPEFLGRCDAKNSRKTFQMALRLFNTHISAILAKIIPEITDATVRSHKDENLTMGNWYSFIEALLYCKKKYPELLTFDLNQSNGAKDYVPLLALAAGSANPELFDLLLKNGAVIDDNNNNYIAIAYEKGGIKASKFVRHLMAKGCSLNAPVQMNGGPCSLLGLCYQRKTYLPYNWIIEDLLMKGAKLLPEEENQYLLDGPGTERHNLALIQKQKTKYSLTQEKMNGFQLLLKLKVFGGHPSFINHDGSIKLEFGDNNKVVIKQEERDPIYTEWKLNGSDVDFQITWADYVFVVVKLYTGRIGLMLKSCNSPNHIDLTKLWICW